MRRRPTVPRPGNGKKETGNSPSNLWEARR